MASCTRGLDIHVQLIYGRRLLFLCPLHKYNNTHSQYKLTILNSTIHYDFQFHATVL